jgi:beta-N-acetylhexosaminidase
MCGGWRLCGVVLLACVLAAGCTLAQPDAGTDRPQRASVQEKTADSEDAGKAKDAASGEERTPVPQNVSDSDQLEAQIGKMTLDEKIGQLFLIRPDALDPSQRQDQIDDADAQGVTALTDAMAVQLAQYPVGGIVLFGKNIIDPEQLRTFTAQLNAAGETPLLLAVDEEGGTVSRLASIAAFDLPQYESMTAIGDTGDTQQALLVGSTIGNYLKDYGFSLDFAPDADVNTNPDNPVIGTRAFSADPQTAADMVAAAVHGFHQAGVLTCLKHFPGHGDTATDTHYGCATTAKTWAEMQRCELLPFESGIAAGADCVMAAHITAPNVTADGLPASLSKEMITEKLRGELGFTGVVVTDSLAMEAVTGFFSPGDAACRAIQAGADILLMPDDLAQSFAAVRQAVAQGSITEQRINESVRRILTLKQKQGLLSRSETNKE